MLALEKQGIIHWLATRGVSNATGELSLSGFIRLIDSAIPPDSGRKTALSRALISFFDSDEEALLWINEYGIWPSSEDRNLFNVFCHGLGENSPLHKKPGYIFSNNDLVNIGSIVSMILYFVWGAVLYSPTK